MIAVTLADQIACVAREITLRKRAFPKFVERGKMKQFTADLEIARMEAVLETLKEQR